MRLAGIICLFTFLLFPFNLRANYGCNIGSYIYPNATGGLNPSGDPYYHNNSPITIRTWDGDTRCGIRNNKIYPRSSGDDNCQVVGGNWGVIYYFNPKDNNCVPLPLDDYAWVLILAVGGMGYFMLRKKLILNSTG
ncbi:hypothetical protein FA048_15950 [Pedobacter polaris]|uniref:Uncharacterized protein n=1 Tax=Pedobacter polaris TaxID=2571273 RepID=A0A4U1CJG7_9SPHI|nr:hypothetical protein [Pedobacter polaris]TKC06694.1 hypothetical protein FA048_15950 [Pedobacter polaris]